jgi:hypothetical protein
MTKLFTLATVSGSSLAGTAGKTMLNTLWAALRSAGITDANRTTVTASATLAQTQCGWLDVDCTSGSVTLTLPASGTTTDEAEYRIRRIDSTSNTLTVQRGGTDTIEGGTNVIIIPPLGQVDLKILAGGTDWRIGNRGGKTKAAYRLVAGIPFRGHVSGFVPSFSAANWTLGAGEAADSTSEELLALTSSITKTTSAWAVGTGNGGLDTGTIANNTWYYAWPIKRIDTGVTDWLFSLSSTAPTLPANYTLKSNKPVAVGLTNGSAQWTAAVVIESQGGGLDYVWSTVPLDVNTTISTSRTTSTLSVPALVVTANLTCFASHATLSTNVKVQCPDENDAAPSGAASPGVDAFTPSGGGATSWPKVVRTNSSGQIASRASQSSTTFRVFTNGFTLHRR